MIKPFLISAFETHKIRALTEWTGQHITEGSQNTQNMTKSYLCIYLASFFTKKTYLGPSLWFTLFWESHKPHELVQTLTVTHKYRMQNVLPPSGFNELLPANLTDIAL